MSIVSNTEILNFLQLAGFSVSVAGQTFLNLIQPSIEGAIQTLLKWQVAQQTFTEYLPETPPQSYFDGEELVQGYDMLGGLVVPRLRGDRANATLQLRHIPVRSITAAYENPAAFGTGVAGGDFPSDFLLPTEAYYLDQSTAGISWTGHLVRYSGIWVSDPRCVKVTYVAGLTTSETDPELAQTLSIIKMATLESITHAYVQQVTRARALATNGPLHAVSLPDFSAQFGPFMLGLDGSLPASAVLKLLPYINYSRYFGR